MSYDRENNFWYFYQFLYTINPKFGLSTTTYVGILGINHCGKLQRTDFKCCELFQYVLCRSDYAERVVARFSHKIQSDYYYGNRSVYIESIELENFIAFTKGIYQFNYTITSTSCSVSLFLSDDSKNDAATNTAHSKSLIALLKGKTLLTKSLSTIWENTGSCAEQYRHASEIYLMSVMSQCY